MSNELQRQTSYSNSITQYKEQNKLIGAWIKNEDELQVANTYQEKKIGNYDREDMARLVEVMAQWRILLGVTSDASEHELIIICQFIYDNFKKFTLSDVKLAMNWSISGKIDVGFVTQKNISSYYISRALNAYDEEKRRIYNQLMYEREKHINRMKQEQKPEITPIDKANSFKDYIVSMFQSYKDGKIVFDLADMAYNWLKRTEQISLDKKVISEAIDYGKRKYLEEKQKEIKNSLQANLFASNESREEREKKLARSYMIMHYFDNIDLPTLVSRIKVEQFIK